MTALQTRQAAQYMQLFRPERQYEVTFDPRRCYNDYSPTLRKTRETLGWVFCVDFGELYINDLCTFMKARRTQQPWAREVAAIIMSQYSWLKVAEFILFFVEVKAGKHGKFFANIEPQDITVKMAEWSKNVPSERYKAECQLLNERWANE